MLDAMSVYMQRQGVQVSEGCKVVMCWLEHTKLTASRAVAEEQRRGDGDRGGGGSSSSGRVEVKWWEAAAARQLEVGDGIGSSKAVVRKHGQHQQQHGW